MNSDVQGQVRAAIAAFLDECQKEARPFAASEALGAIRNMFPDMDISDADLQDAIVSEASATGFDIQHDSSTSQKIFKRQSLERWDDEGGATSKRARKPSQFE